LEKNKIGEVTMMWFPMNMNAPGAAGTLIKSPLLTPGDKGPLIYFTSVTEDLTQDQRIVEEARGSVTKEKTAIGEHVFFMICKDTEGNQFAIHSMKG